MTLNESNQKRSLRLRFSWKRLLLAALAVGSVLGLAGMAVIVDRVSVSFLTGQRRAPGTDWFGNAVREDGPTPGYAFLGYSESHEDPPGFRITRPADEGVEYGLRKGDIVTRVAGRVFTSSFDAISWLLTEYCSGEVVPISVVRGSQHLRLDVRLRPYYRTPADLGLNFEDVSIPSRSGYQLEGWYIPAPWETGPERVLVYVHGAKASRYQALDSAAQWHERGYSVLAMDLSGRGSSSGDYVTYTSNERLDVLSILQWVQERRKVPLRRTVLFGTSNGAATAIYAAAETPDLGLLILDAPYSDLWSETQEALEARGIPGTAATLLRIAVRLRAGFDLREVRPLDRIAEVTAPTLFVHGSDDHSVLPYHSERLHDRRVAAGRYSDRWVIPSGEHGFDGYPSDFWDRLADFADERLKSSISASAVPPEDDLFQ